MARVGGFFSDVLRERACAGDEFHGDEGDIDPFFVMDTGFEDLDDSGVLEAAQQRGFAGEAFTGTGGDQTLEHDFEGDGTVRGVLHCFVDDTHAAGSDGASDGEGGDAGAVAEMLERGIVFRFFRRVGLGGGGIDSHA